MARQLAAIMFTDIAGFTPLAQADEAGALRLLQEQERLVRPLLEAHRGRKVKSIGDGLLIEFPNALDAVECGVELQRRVHEHNAVEGARPLRMRVGIHLGDVQRRGTDILGDAVNIASRIEPLAEPGGVSLTNQVYDQVSNKLPYQFEKLGPKNLKGVRQPIDIYRVLFPWSSSAAVVEGPRLPRLAVLPLTNISPDPNDEYFADGMTEELISTISKLRELSVISRTSVMQYKVRAKHVTEIGRELNAGTILEGSVRKAGNRVRIAVQLIDAVGDKHLWAENYDRSLEDIFSIQSEIAQKVATALQIRLLEADIRRIGKAPTDDTEAYLLYLKGQFHRRRVAKEEYTTALGYFEQALQKDPRYALAYATMAETYSFLGLFEMMPSQEASAKAEEAARKALQLDASLAEAHLALYWVMLNSLDFAGAVKEIQRALDLSPNLSRAHISAGAAYLYTWQFDKAQAETDRGLELDPRSLSTMRDAATLYLYSGRPERAAELFEQVIEMDPANTYALNNLGLCHVRQGRYEEGIAEVRRAVEMSTGPAGTQSDIVYALAKAGRTGEARRLVAEMVRMYNEHGTGAAAVAEAYASVGDRDEAFEWLERAYEEHSGQLSGVSVDFAFEAMHSDPRFQRFLGKMGYPSNMTTAPS